MRTRRGPIRSLSFCALFLWSIACAVGQQYSLTEWKHEDGLPSTAIYAITQSSDGFLWLGSADGLIQYDGFQFNQRSLAGFGLRPLGKIRALAAAPDGHIFAGTASGMVVKLGAQAATKQTVKSAVDSISLLPTDKLLVSAGASEYVLSSTTLDVVSNRATDRLPHPSDCRSIQAPKALESQHNLPAWRLLHEGGSASNNAEITSCLHDRSGGLWFGTANHGVFLTRNGATVAHFARVEGLTSDRVTALFEDREANIWVATENGLNRLRPDKFVTFSETDNATDRVASELAPGENGKLWLGSQSGISQLHESRRSPLYFRGNVRAMTTDGKGGLFALVDDKLVQLDEGRGKTTPLQTGLGEGTRLAGAGDGTFWIFSPKGGLQYWRGATKLQAVSLPPNETVTTMATGSDGLWVALTNGRLLQVQGSKQASFAPSYGHPEARITYLEPTSPNSLWIATDAGLLFFNGHVFTHWDRSVGLPGDRLLWVKVDRDDLWIGYSIGVAKVSIRDLFEQASGKTGLVKPVVYDDGDGLQGNPEVRGSAPVTETSDGKLWFTMAEGVARIDPRNIPKNLLPPPTHIVQLIVDGTEIPLHADIQLKPHTRTIQFGYAGLSLTDPRKVRFRYRLDGFDDRWQEVGTRHNAFYTNLRPGHYQFHVLASNNDGVWNETGDHIGFEILPAFYETNWFRALCILLTFCLIGLFYRLRLRSSRRQLQLRYDIQTAERNRLAGDLHDNLIQEMMAVTLQLEVADAATPSISASKVSLKKALSLTQQAIRNGRGTLQQLQNQPFTWKDIVSSLQDIVDQGTVSGTTNIHFSHSGQERLLEPTSGEEVLQIAREAVRNAVRYAPGSPVSVRAAFGRGDFCLTIKDQGPGITSVTLRTWQPGHFGVRSMRERASRIGARLELKTGEDVGTEWTLTLPAERAYVSANEV